MEDQSKQLVRGLSITTTISLVVGGVIGTGVFLKTATMANQIKSPTMIILAWVIAGILSLAGALTYAELSSLIPKTGGEYAYLKEAYGKIPAFLYGWMRFILGGPGSIAAYVFGLSIFLSLFLPTNQKLFDYHFSLFSHPIDFTFTIGQGVAILAITLLSLFNCLGVKFGGQIQATLTTIKVLGLVFVIVGIFFFCPNPSWEHFATPMDTKMSKATSMDTTSIFSWLGLFGAAIVSALWPYDGWNQVVMAAGEVKNPQKNLPRALIFGMLTVLGIYVLANVAYMYALPFEKIQTSYASDYHKEADPLVANAVKTFAGQFGAKLACLLGVISTLGALNGSILTSARVPFAMANDGLFFSKLAQVSPKTYVPVWSIVIQAIIACVFVLSGSYDTVTDMVIFAAWIFYGMNTFAVFLLRKKMKPALGTYRTFGYPITPILFILGSLAIIILSLSSKASFIKSRDGLGLILLGLPFYFYFQRKNKKPYVPDKYS